MKTILHELRDNKLITPPDFVVDNLCLLIHGGSFAYGCSTENSDYDLIGICMPDHKHLYGQGILAFDDIPVFNEYQQHHIQYNGQEYDVKIYGLPRIFKLAMQGNPNILDILSSPDFSILYEDLIGIHLRANHTLFFSKECVSRFLGFSDNHFKSMEGRMASGKYPESRQGLYEKYGYDTKDAVHCIRALFSIRDMLHNYDYEVDRYKEVLWKIKSGQMSYEECTQLRNNLRLHICELEKTTMLQDKPDYDCIRSYLEYYIKIWG